MTEAFRSVCHKYMSQPEYACFFKKFERLLLKTKRNPPSISSVFDLIYLLLDKRRDHFVPNSQKKWTLIGMLDGKIIGFVRIVSKHILDSSKLALVVKILTEIHAEKALKELFMKSVDDSLHHLPLLDIIDYLYETKDFSTARYFMQLAIRKFSHLSDCWVMFYSKESLNGAPEALLNFIKTQAQDALTPSELSIFKDITAGLDRKNK